LFSNKPLVIALNKIDVQPLENLTEGKKKILDSLKSQEDIELIPMSSLEGDGVSKVKEVACDKLLEQRVELKLSNKNVLNSMNRLHVATPVPRDQLERLPFIPSSVFEKNKKDTSMETNNNNQGAGIIFTTHKVKTEEELEKEEEAWDPTVFGPDFRSEYLLSSNEWKFDNIPEIMDGKNIADYIDPDIMERLEELEQEEEKRQLLFESQYGEGLEDYEELNEEEEEQFYTIDEKKKLKVKDHRIIKRLHQNRPIFPRTERKRSASELKSHLEEMGIEPTKALKRARSESRSRSRSASTAGRKKQRTESKERSISRSKTPGDGFKDIEVKLKVDKLIQKSRKTKYRRGEKGEGDRTIVNLKPKHLYSGKRVIGKNQRI
jgi:nucleolar GTP-binding protein